MADKIDALFENIETTRSNNDDCESLFARLKMSIDEYELIDETKYYLYSTKYFRAKADYLRSKGFVQDAVTQDQLAARFQLKHQQRQLSSPRQNPSSVPPVSSDQTTLEQALRSALDLLVTKIMEREMGSPVKNIIVQLRKATDEMLSQKLCESLDDYSRLRTLADAIHRLALSTHDPLTDQTGEHSACIDAFRICTRDYLYERRIFFGRFLLDHPAAMFANVPLFETNIDTHTRRLAALFHTDKAKEDEDRFLFHQVFVQIYSEKEVLLTKVDIATHKSETVEKLKKLGYEHWLSAINISRARKGRWNDVQYLDVDSLRNMTETELATLQHNCAIQAYEYYRMACNTLGNDGELDGQIELRKFMALALHIAGSSKYRLEAQIYAIAAVHLYVDRATNFSLDTFQELQKLLVKVQGSSSNSPLQANEPTTPVSPPLNTGDLVPYYSTTRSLAHIRRDIQAAIAADTRRVVLRKCLVRGNSLRINTAEESILEAKLQATQSRTRGVVVAVGGAAVTGMIGAEIYKDVMVGFAAGSLLGPVGSIIGASIGLVGGGFLGYLLIKKGGELYKEPLIREELNEILGEASKCHQDGNIDGFFATLNKTYEHGKKRLLKLTLIDSYVELQIDSERIVQELLSHEFRPDGIAYLLILMGEVLLTGPTLRIENHANQLDSRSASAEARKLFRLAYSSVDLQDKAKYLDSKVTQIKLEDRMRRVKQMYQMFNKSVYSIPKEYFDDAITTPFATRLFELSHIARLNFAISHLIEGERENLQRSYHAIQNLKADLQKVKRQHFFQLPQMRIQALEDLLAAFGFFDDTVENLSIASRKLLSIESPMTIELIDKFLPKSKSIMNCEQVIAVTDTTQNLFVLEQLLLNTSRVRPRHLPTDSPASTMSVKNLQAIAESYRSHFQLCLIQSHPEHGRIFVSEGEMIICPKLVSGLCIYLVLDDERNQIIAMFTVAEPLINSLHAQLLTTKSSTEKARINVQIAQIYHERAKTAEQQHHLLALPLWYEALQYYTAARQLTGPPDVIFGLLRCMLMLGRYERVEATIRNLLLNSMAKSGEAWYLQAVSYRKQAKFDDAHYAARQALQFDYVGAQEELNLCETLKSERGSERIKVYERMTTSNALIHRTYPSYNILTIDGGGARGIIPAVWLCELERLTKRSCSSLFDMMAGTSTGAIITTGLSIPTESGEEPRYKALDILKLYRTQARSVFSLPSSMLNRVTSRFSKSARYTDTGRHDIFQKYYGDACLSDLLVDTVIPVVTAASNGTRLFTHRRISDPPVANYKIQDILMCTTAAPTYFHPYMLDSTLYVDGGVQANNPTMEAFRNAISYGVPQENIFILSLGTGDYVPNPLHPDASRNFLFWATHSDTVTKAIFDGPQNNIDLSMSHLLGEKHYHRWQVWLEKPVALDDTRETTLDVLCDLAREHFEALDALDSQKRLGLFIEHLKGM